MVVGSIPTTSNLFALLLLYSDIDLVQVWWGLDRLKLGHCYLFESDSLFVSRWCQFKA
jgi:hypothetical protein